MYKLLLLAAVLSALTAISYTAPGFMEEAEEEADSKDDSLKDFIKKAGSTICKYVPLANKVCKAKTGDGEVTMEEFQELLGLDDVQMMDDDDDDDDTEMDTAEMEDFIGLCPYVPIADKICETIGSKPSL